MADEYTNIPADEQETSGEPVSGAPVPPATIPEQPNEADTGAASDSVETYEERLERLGGEPAPVITPEEFARLQKAGQVHIDARGRVRTTRREESDGGVSLKKRRAWYQS